MLWSFWFRQKFIKTYNIFKMKTTQKGSVKILIVILSVLIIAAGIYFYINKKEKNEQISNTQVTSEATINKFLGSWSWVSSDESASFGFNLKPGTEMGSVYGNYCAVAFNGNRVDCDPYKKDSFIGTLNGDELKINFIDAYGGGVGTAILNYNSDNSISWKITEKPDGGYYIPENVILEKDSKNTEYYNP